MTTMTSSSSNKVITIASINIKGQSGLPTEKQKQIEDFIKFNKIDILHCQEINTDVNAHLFFLTSILLVIMLSTSMVSAL